MTDDGQRGNLIWVLRDRLPFERITPTHVVGSDHFPDPPLIEGHRPDLLAESFAGTLVIGIAKDASELDSDLSAEQYRTFANYQDPKSGERAALVVAVRGEHQAQAEDAIEKAGLTLGSLLGLSRDAPRLMTLDPIVSLSVAIAEAPGSHAFFLGSGISREAGVPTGQQVFWQAAGELYRLEEETEDTLDEEALGEWLKKTDRDQLGYSDLLELIAPDPG